MGFNLNISRKPEFSLNENMTHEAINMYGIPVKWLYSEKVNKNFVFNDFTHMKVGKEYQDLYLMPEDTSNWEGDVAYNSFGIFNQWSQNLFISKASILKLYPDFLTEQGNRSKVLNSLLITPSNTILEVTHIESFNVGINNVWSFGDDTSVYKLTVKIYSNNLADEGTNIQDSIILDEDEIHDHFRHEEEIDTSDIDVFFNTLSVTKEKQDVEGSKISNNNNPFGSMS